MSASATVVAFPSMTPQARLNAAVCRLQQALRAQAVAVSEWRRSVADLQRATARLNGSVRQYGDQLGALAGNVATLHGAARELETRADRIARR